MRRLCLLAFLFALALPAAAQTWDVSCPGGQFPQQVTALSNGHLKAVMCVDSTGTITPTAAFNGSSSSLPSGSIILTLTSCPSGFSEVAALDGNFLQGTLAAHGDVGTTGGNATITPSGTVSTPTFTGGSNTTSAVSAGTPAGTNGTVSFTPAGTNASTTSGATSGGTPAGTNAATATSGNCAATNIAAGTGSTTACKGTAPNLTVPAETFTGSALATHTHTVPAETFTGTAGTVPAETFTGSALGTHSHTVTPTGTVSQPSFTGNAIDPRPAFVKVIFCSAN